MNQTVSNLLVRIIQLPFTCGELKLHYKIKKNHKYFLNDLIKIFLLVLTSFKMHGSLENGRFLAGKSKSSR